MLVPALILLVSLTQAAFPAFPNDLWFLNTYLQHQTIGYYFDPRDGASLPFIGLCPSDPQRCKLEFATLPASIKSIGITLPFPFDYAVDIGTLLTQGHLEAYEVQINDVELSGITISSPTTSPTFQDIRILVTGFKASIDMHLNFIDIKIPKVNFGVGPIFTKVTLDKNTMTTGTNLDFTIGFQAAPGKTFADSFPLSATLSACSISLDLNLAGHVAVDTNYPFTNSINSVTQLLLAVAEPLLGKAVCGLIDQLFTLPDPTKPGFIQEIVNKTFFAVRDLSLKPQPVLATEEASIISGLSQSDKDGAVHFASSTVLKGASTVLNNYLGVGNPSNPVVNDVINLLTSPNNGTASFTGLESLGTKFTIHTPIVNIEITLKNATLGGLNTFGSPNGFHILQNGFTSNSLNFTIDNSLSLRHVSAKIGAEVKLITHYYPETNPLLGDAWMVPDLTSSGDSSMLPLGLPDISFFLDYSISLDQLDIQAALTIVNDPSRLSGLQLGQLLGKSTGATTAVAQALAGAKCSASSMLAFGLPSMKLQLNNINNPLFNMYPEDHGIENMVNAATNRILQIFESPTTTGLGDISQFVLRPIVNKILKNFFVAGGAEIDCPIYQTQGKITPNFLTSRIFSSASTLIRDAIGGNPVKSNSVSINQLLEQVVLFGCEAFANPGTCLNNGNGQWKFFPGFSIGPGKSFPVIAPFPSSIQIPEIDVNGVNSIYKLLLDNIPGSPQAFRLRLALGTFTNPLSLTFKNHWLVNYVAGTKADVDENFNIAVSIQNFDLDLLLNPDFDLNQLYLLHINDLGHSACLTAPLIALFLNLNLTTAQFTATITHTPGPFNNASNELTAALNVAASEFHPNLNNMISVILKSVAKFAGNFASSYSNGGVTATNCRQQRNLFDTVISRLISAALTSNWTEAFAKATGEQPPVVDLDVLDNIADANAPFGTIPFNLLESNAAKFISDGIGGISQASFNKLMQDLGNQTGDILSDSFVNEADGTTSLDINFLRYDRFKSGFSLAALIENATFILNRVRLSGLSRLNVGNLRVLKPIKKYVMDTNIEIPGRMSFLLNVSISLPVSLIGETSGKNELTTIQIALDLDDLTIGIQTLTALNGKNLNGLSLGNFVSVDENQQFGFNFDGINCIFRLFFPGGLSIPKLQIGVSSLGSPSLTVSNNKFISVGTQKMLQATLRILADFYAKDLKDITQGGLRTLINDFFLTPNVENPGICAPSQTNVTKIYLDFEKSPTVQFIYDLTTSVLAGSDGKYGLLNTVLTAALNGKEFFADGIGFNRTNIVYKKKPIGAILGEMRGLSINNLGTITKLNLLDARNNYTTSNNVSLAGPLAVKFTVDWTIFDLWVDDNGKGVQDELEFTLQLKNVTLAAFLTLQVNVKDLLGVQVGSFNNFSQIACVLTAFEQFKLKNFVFDVDNVVTSVRCAGTCQSPLFKGLQAGGTVSSGENNNIAKLIPSVIQLAVNYLNSQGFGASVDQSVDNSASNCAQALNLTTAIEIFNPPDQAHLNVAIIFGLALLGVFSAGFLLVPLLIPRHYQLKDRLLAENLQSANSQPGANAQSVARFMAKAEREEIALAWHPAIPICCKIFLPAMAIANVLMLVLSFVVYLSFSVNLQLTILGSKSDLLTLVPWTISSTINDMWNGGAAPLSILIVFASCAWPVFKNLALVYIWYAPKTLLTHESREFYLILLDILGKWSFLDVYIIVLLVAALKFRIFLSDTPALSVIAIADTFLILDVIISPASGIVILCIAAFMSLIVNHIIIWYMEHAKWADKRLFKQIDGEDDDMLTPKANIRLAISDYVFSTVNPQGQRDRFGPRSKNSIVIMLVVAVIWLIVGYILPYFTLLYNGLIGITLQFLIEGGRTRTFSLLTVGLALGTASNGTAEDTVLFLFFEVLFFVTVLIAPVLQMLLHIFLWLKPLSLKDAKTVLFFAKVAAYWASVEVFCLAVIALTIEVKPVTLFLIDFITGGSCTAARGLLADLLGAGDGSCLEPGAHVEYGFFISFASNLFQIGCGAVMIRASGLAIRDREHHLERTPLPPLGIAEYHVLNVLFVNGAEHHKPPPQALPKIFQALLLVLCQEPPQVVCKNCAKASCHLANPLTCCENCCKGVDDVSLMTPVGQTAGKVTNSKWNAPPQASTQNKWNTVQSVNRNTTNGAPVSASPSWAQKSTNSQNTHSMVGHSQNIEAPNPIFTRESHETKRFSVDV